MKKLQWKLQSILRCIKMKPLLVWFTGLSLSLWTEGSLVDSQSGHMPGLPARSPVGGVQEAKGRYLSHFPSPSLPLSLKINKIVKKWRHDIPNTKMQYDNAWGKFIVVSPLKKKDSISRTFHLKALKKKKSNQRQSKQKKENNQDYKGD